MECHMRLSVLLNFAFPLNLLFFINNIHSYECLFLSCYITDQDECAVNIDGCDQNCHNTNGSFSCSCNNGYRLNVDDKTCDG